MTQQLRAFPGLAENLSSVPKNPRGGPQPSATPVPKNPVPSSGL